MEATAHRARPAAGRLVKDSLLRRKYVIPFLLACIILSCNTATGVNSIIGYNTGILLQSGLSDLYAHWGYVLFTIVNFLMTAVGMTLVDRKGRRFLLVLGTSGIIIAMIGVGVLFKTTEKLGVDCRDALQALVAPEQQLTLHFDQARRRNCSQPRATRVAISIAIARPWRSFIPMAISLRQPRLCDRTIRRPLRLKLPAQAPCRPTESRRCSKIRLLI